MICKKTSLNGFGRPAQDLSVTSLWSGKYAPKCPVNIPKVPDTIVCPVLSYELIDVAAPYSTIVLDSNINVSIVSSDENPLEMTVRWSVPITTDNGGSPVGGQTILKSLDGFLFLGNFYQNATLYNATAPTTPVRTLAGSNETNVLVKYGSKGNVVWCTKTQADANGVFGGQMALDIDGNIYTYEKFVGGDVTLSAYNTFTPPLSILSVTSNADGASRGCLIKRNKDGLPLWMAKVEPGAGSAIDTNATPLGIVTTSSSIYTLTAFDTNVDIFQPTSQDIPAVTVNFSVGPSTALIVKYELSGTWYGNASITAIPTNQPFDACTSICRDPSVDAIFVITPFEGNTCTLIDVEGSTIATYTKTSLYDSVVARLDFELYYTWSKQISTDVDHSVVTQSVTVHDNQVYVTFIYTGPVTVDTFTLVAPPNLTDMRSTGLLILDADSGNVLSLNSIADGVLQRSNFLVDDFNYYADFIVSSVQSYGTKVKNLDGTDYCTVPTEGNAPLTFARFNDVGVGSEVSALRNASVTNRQSAVIAPALIGLATGFTGTPIVVTSFGQTVFGYGVNEYTQVPFTSLLVIYNVAYTVQLDDPAERTVKYIVTDNLLVPVSINTVSPVVDNGMTYYTITLLKNGSTISLYWNETSWQILSQTNISLS